MNGSLASKPLNPELQRWRGTEPQNPTYTRWGNHYAIPSGGFQIHKPEQPNSPSYRILKLEPFSRHRLPRRQETTGWFLSAEGLSRPSHLCTFMYVRQQFHHNSPANEPPLPPPPPPIFI